MTVRYFSDTPIVGDRVALTGPEAHHLVQVMRAKPGDELILFDGSGVEFAARVSSTKGKQAECEVVERREVDRELPIALTAAVALPKGDRQKFLIEKLVELGVTRLAPLTTQRGVAQPVDGAVERLRRSVVEASKQCGRNRLMEVSPGVRWLDFLKSPLPELRLIAHPYESVPFHELPLTSMSAVAFAVGPEGGFSDAEIEAGLAAGWRTVSLGPRILRVETAASALASLLGCRPFG